MSGFKPIASENNNSFFLRKSMINQRNQSDLKIIRTKPALTSSNNRIKPKTYKLCVPNLVPKKVILGHS